MQIYRQITSYKKLSESFVVQFFAEILKVGVARKLLHVKELIHAQRVSHFYENSLQLADIICSCITFPFQHLKLLKNPKVQVYKNIYLTML